MRWNSKIKIEPKLGDKREVQKFAIFPKRIGDTKVWFEKYISIQEYSLLTYHQYDEAGIWETRKANGWWEINRRLK